ncbi:hypothetical protein TRIUR3_16349 [Triticum urartu]|uniref:Uncharacterized protein n=1 Tax=Triticum urartu TaxID=4572 RepID=M7ZSY8_TRIUA|nr:hypothetical protein TRIUR3_16349 [Triticum urartu]
MQMQSSLELAEKEHRKMFEKITERAEEMKVHLFDSMFDPVLVKLMTEVQSSPQLAEEHRKMFEKIAEHAEEMKKLMTEVQSSLQLAEKEHRKMFEKIAEHAEEMKDTKVLWFIGSISSFAIYYGTCVLSESMLSAHSCHLRRLLLSCTRSCTTCALPDAFDAPLLIRRSLQRNSRGIVPRILHNASLAIVCLRDIEATVKMELFLSGRKDTYSDFAEAMDLEEMGVLVHVSCSFKSLIAHSTKRQMRILSIRMEKM